MQHSASPDIPSLPAATPAVDDDLPCAACGYNLRGCAWDGTCPECGASVERARKALLRYCDAHWLRQVAQGPTALLAATAAFMFLAPATAAILDEPSLARRLAAALLYGAWLCATAGGVWQWTRPDPMETVSTRSTLRIAARWLCTASLAMLTVSLLAAVAPRTASTPATFGVFAAWHLLAAFILLLLHARRLALRVPHPALAGFTLGVMLALAVAVKISLLSWSYLDQWGWSAIKAPQVPLLINVWAVVQYVSLFVIALSVPALLALLMWHAIVLRRQADLAGRPACPPGLRPRPAPL